jgi:hypothetical protein
LHKHSNRRKVLLVWAVTTLLVCLLSTSLPLNISNQTASAADNVFYDFIVQADNASWSTGAGSLPFPGSDSDSRGFALYRDSWQLEDNSTRARVLETHPQWVNGGWIMGRYPQVTVPSDAELKIIVGFLNGATGSDGVIFKVQFEEGQTRQTILTCGASYDSKLDTMTQSLSSLEGKTGRFILYVDSGQGSGQDWAAWAEAKIEVAAPELPDLIVSKIECGPGNKLSVTIKNIGSGNLPGGWAALAKTYFDDEAKGSFDLTSPTSTSGGGIEEAGGSSTYLLAWDITAPVTVRVMADSTNDITESDEQNNSKEKEVEPLVGELPDLVITEIACDQQNSRIGYVLKNSGQAVAPAGHATVLFVDGEAICKDVVSQELAPGEIYKSWFDGYTWPQCQTLKVMVCADNSTAVAESDEQNNCLEKTCECVADNTSPKITSGPTVSQITQTTAVICWETDEASDSLVRYDCSSGKFDAVVEDQSLLKEHCLNLTNLEPATTYCFVVESGDASGNRVTSRALSFEALSPADKEKPSLSLLVPGTVSGKVLITADARDNIGVDRVVFLLDGEAVHTDYTPPFEWEYDSSSIDDGPHSFGARTTDAAGNVSEVVREGDARNRFPISETPVTVAIINPVSRSEVYGIVEIRATVTQEKGAEITHTEVRIDGHTVQQTDISPLKITPPAPERSHEPTKPTTVRYLWDTRRLAEGIDYVIEVLARDEFGNDGQRGIIVTKVAEPEVPFSVERAVTPNGNYFHVDVTVRNLGTGDDYNATNLIIRDESRGFQAAVFERTPLYDWRRSEVTIEKWAATLPAGEAVSFSYNVVPVLFDPMLDDYTIGISTTIEYEDAFMRRQTQEYATPYLPGDYVSLPYPLLPEQVGNAFDTTDYVIVTDPERLFRHSDATDVNRLLSTMAELAVCKNGVLGYRRTGTDWITAQTLKNNLKAGGIWGSRLSLESVHNGYLLLVGETDIIPAFTMPSRLRFRGETTYHTVYLSDSPYADVCGDDNLPELKVGRIIGNTASDLITPITTSIAVYRGDRLLGNDSSDALVVSGAEDTWEQFVQVSHIIGDIIRGKGVNVEHQDWDYYETPNHLLAEALLIGYRGSFDRDSATTTRPDPRDFTLERLITEILERADVDVASGTELAHLAQACREAERIEEARRGGDYGSYDTSYGDGDAAEAARCRDFKTLTPNKDIIFFTGHGDPGGWCGGFANWTVAPSSVSGLSFDRASPIILAVSCSTGNYDAAISETDLPCGIAEAFLAHGTAVYIGSTEKSPADAAHGEEYGKIFFRDYWRSDRPIGEVFTEFERNKMMTSDEWWHFVVNEFNLYGDPKFGGR